MNEPSQESMWLVDALTDAIDIAAGELEAEHQDVVTALMGITVARAVLLGMTYEQVTQGLHELFIELSAIKGKSEPRKGPLQ